MSASKSRSRSSSRATSSSPRALVSTMASLQYSMPVQAIVPRRQADGRASSPIPRSAATSDSTWSVGDVQHQQLLVRREPHPAAAVRLGDVGQLAELRAGDPPDHRGGADVVAAVALLVHADVVDRLRRQLRRRAVEQRPAEVLLLQHLAEPLARPSRRPGTSAGPGCAAGGSRSRGRSPTTPAQTSGTSSSGTQTPSRWASIGLVDRPPPTHRSKPGPCSGCSTPRKEMSFDLVRRVRPARRSTS